MHRLRDSSTQIRENRRTLFFGKRSLDVPVDAVSQFFAQFPQRRNGNAISGAKLFVRGVGDLKQRAHFLALRGSQFAIMLMVSSIASILTDRFRD